MIDQLVEIHRTIQELADRPKQPVPRNVHPKQHGCLWGEFIVRDDLTPELRQGVFRSARRIPALVRFSNAKQADDRLADGHGLAIKLLDVPGPRLLEQDQGACTQDFILVDHPVFFAKNVEDMIPLMHTFRSLLTGGTLEKAAAATKAAISQDYRFKLLRQAGSKRPENVLAIPYWSMTPFCLGDRAVKFVAKPTLETVDQTPSVSSSPDRFRNALSEHLRRLPAAFDFFVQLQTDAARTPIEDASAEWTEADAPLRHVATLVLPPQVFDTPERTSFGGALSFSPWHGITDHRPLGGINRARRKLYHEMAAHRRLWNGEPLGEPSLAQARAVFTGAA